MIGGQTLICLHLVTIVLSWKPEIERYSDSPDQ